jgi:hypothetical protein
MNPTGKFTLLVTVPFSCSLILMTYLFLHFPFFKEMLDPDELKRAYLFIGGLVLYPVLLFLTVLQRLRFLTIPFQLLVLLVLLIYPFGPFSSEFYQLGSLPAFYPRMTPSGIFAEKAIELYRHVYPYGFGLVVLILNYVWILSLQREGELVSQRNSFYFRSIMSSISYGFLSPLVVSLVTFLIIIFAHLCSDIQNFPHRILFSPLTHLYLLYISTLKSIELIPYGMLIGGITGILGAFTYQINCPPQTRP